MSAPTVPTETTPTPVPSPQGPRTNTKAILALVFAFVFWPIAIILGHRARKEIRTSGEAGYGMATAGMVLGYIGLGFVTLLLIVSVAAAGSVPTDRGPVGPLSGPTLNAGAAPTLAPAAPAGPVSSFGAGTYEVGTDIVPGTYKTAGPTGAGGLCYWARHSDASGEGDSLIANDLGRGPMVVTAKASDALLETHGCQAWTKVR